MNTTISSRSDRAKWFGEARFGIFIHWGPYAVQGRGEQVLIRELLDPAQYEREACAWNPSKFDARAMARVARDAGARYLTLTTRHHDGYCLWDSKLTDYTSVKQAPKRDFVREYVDACRAEGLRVGLYYSLADFRVPAYFDGPAKDPAGWNTFRDYVHGQVRELLTDYGQVDTFWFDGAWPRSAEEWGSRDLLRMMRSLQPNILINNRLDSVASNVPGQEEQAGASEDLGDFGTPEHHITADAKRAWESCQVSTWRLWGYTRGERWRPADLLLDMLTEAASKGGNLLLNVGPDEHGALPSEFVDRMRDIGDWMRVHGECIYASEGGDVTESVTYGRQIRKGCMLYLVMRFWDGRPQMRVYGLGNRVVGVTLLTTGAKLSFKQVGPELFIEGLPAERPTPLFPVIRIECDSVPKPVDSKLAMERLWMGDASRYSEWARQRGTTVNVLK
jgi:alpha-L-fucosidase